MLPVISITSATPRSVPPTTAIPMTAPPRKPDMNAGLMPFWAASVVFVLAMVAMRMPTTPATAENAVPHRYAIVMVMFSTTFPCQMG